MTVKLRDQDWHIEPTDDVFAPYVVCAPNGRTYDALRCVCVPYTCILATLFGARHTILLHDEGGALWLEWR